MPVDGCGYYVVRLKGEGARIVRSTIALEDGGMLPSAVYDSWEMPEAERVNHRILRILAGPLGEHEARLFQRGYYAAICDMRDYVKEFGG